MIADRVLEAARPLLITARGRCYRWESVNFRPLERLWDFQMREIIVVGRPQQVERLRQSLIERTRRFVESLDLAGRVESAHDPFFTSESTGKLLLQRLKAIARLEGRSAVDEALRHFREIDRKVYAEVSRHEKEPWKLFGQDRPGVGPDGPAGRGVPRGPRGARPARGAHGGAATT